MNIKTLEKHCDYSISVYDALTLLCDTFKADMAAIYLDSNKLVLSDLYDMDEEEGIQPAKNIRLTFYGGPPPGCWWCGTLYTLLIDHLLYAFIKGDTLLVLEALEYINNQYGVL